MTLPRAATGTSDLVLGGQQGSWTLSSPHQPRAMQEGGLAAPHPHYRELKITYSLGQMTPEMFSGEVIAY